MTWEVQALTRSVDRSRVHGDKPIGLRDALILVLSAAKFSCCEIAGLQVRDVACRDGRVWIRIGNRLQELAVDGMTPYATARILNEYLTARRDRGNFPGRPLLFGRRQGEPITQRHVRRLIQEYREEVA